MKFKNPKALSEEYKDHESYYTEYPKYLKMDLERTLNTLDG